jgi:hypothetical protein
MKTTTGRWQGAARARPALRCAALFVLFLLAACGPGASADKADPAAEQNTMYLLAQVRADLNRYTPPTCDFRDTPEQWAVYQQALVRALGRLLAMPEAESTPLATLEVIFQAASGGWPVRLYSGDASWVMAALQHGACRYASHYGVGEDIYVFGRSGRQSASGGEWWLGRAGRVAAIAWIGGEWRLAVDLSTSTISGERQYTFWHIAATTDGWGRVVEFTPDHPDLWRAADWRIEGNGRVIAQLARPLAEPPCKLPADIMSMYAYASQEVEISYAWRGQSYAAAEEKMLSTDVYLLGKTEADAPYPLGNWRDYCQP